VNRRRCCRWRSGIFCFDHIKEKMSSFRRIPKGHKSRNDENRKLTMSELLIINERLTEPAQADTTLTLPFDLRQKSRLRVTLDDGREAGLMLSRGHILRGGDCLRAEDGTVVRVQAAPENVSTLTHDNPLELARAAYHLGNRHVSLQVGDGWLRYLTDHVLDDMVIAMGMHIAHEPAPFEPESGAYHSQGHGHSHEHSHDHTHEHQFVFRLPHSHNH
jgi:urease accessory protein